MDIEQLSIALKNADAAGDTAAARQLAAAIKQIQQQQPQQLGLTTPSAPVQNAAPTGPRLDDDGSIFDSLGQGLSFGFSDEIAGGLGASANSVANLFGGGIDKSFGEVYQGIRDQARYNNDAFSQHNPKTAIASEIGGGLLTGGVGALRAGALRGGQSLGRLAGVGGVEGAVYGAGASKADTAEGVAKDAATSGVLGAATAGIAPTVLRATGGLLNRAAGGIGDAADRVYQAAVNRLENAGVRLTTGQQTGAGAVKSVESSLGDTFFGSSLRETFDTQRTQLQRRLFDLAGFSADDAADGVLTQEALDRTRRRFGQRYDDALDGREVRLNTDEFLNELGDIEARHLELLPLTEQRAAVTNVINDVLDEAGRRPLTGQAYQRIRSKMGQRQRQLQNRDASIADLYGSLQDALDDAFVRANGNTRTLNREYAHFRQLERIHTNNAGAKANRLPLATLANLAAKSPGSREWRDLTSAAYQVLNDAVPNSGTASRGANLATVGGLLTAPSTTGLSLLAPAAASHGLARGVGANALRGGQNAANAGANVVQRLDNLAAPLGLLGTPAAVPLLGN